MKKLAGVVAGMLAVALVLTAAPAGAASSRGASTASAPAPAPPPLPPAPAMPTRGHVVAIFPIEDQGNLAGADAIEDLEYALVRELEAVGGLTVLGPRLVAQRLAGIDFTGHCSDDAGCAGLKGRYAAAHESLAVRVAAIGGMLNVSLRLVETGAGRELSRVASSLPDQGFSRLQELHHLVVQLVMPERYTGALQIKSAVDGAEVYVDDTAVGATPMRAPLAGIKAGPHILRVSKSGYADVYQFVDVIYRRTVIVEVDLEHTAISGVLVEKTSDTGFGQLFVATQLKGVEVRVDGEPQGITPLGVIEHVAAGKRQVSLHAKDTPPVVIEVEVQADRRTELGLGRTPQGLSAAVLRIAPRDEPLPAVAVVASTDGTSTIPTLLTATAAPPPPPPTPGRGWLFWGLAGAAGVSAGAYAYLGVRTLQHRENAYSQDYVGAQREIAAGKQTMIAANVAAALALAAAGGWLWLRLTDEAPTSE